ncbi:Bgt-2662 [Blumeria graminis f. sp. tritici]|uniref:Bgt-2662 n=2 Tax=Blumeria graminis f. sp. tritici TaxID=62690 RepID=A0A061HLT5_BLUGR|nr:Transcriptional regulator [Blumeria graminis f. sp. tritici 96224]VDB83978.1 Bgt-2662 [Blumeria graminis f. sp. tritici]
MPLLPSQKGTGKKGRDPRHSRSRNSTPSLPGNVGSLIGSDGATPFLELPTHAFRATEDFSSSYAGGIPNSKELDTLLDRLKNLIQVVESRSSACDKGMRLLAQSRKDRLEEIEAERREEENKERLKQEVQDEEERGKNKGNKNKRRKVLSGNTEETPLNYGAHGLANQDGTNLRSSKIPQVSVPITNFYKDTSSTNVKSHVRKISRDAVSSSSSLSPPAAATPVTISAQDKDIEKENDSSSDEHQPLPAPAITNMKTFGDDPSTFPDPTVYEIPEAREGKTREELKEIFSVAYYPETDLDDLIPGTPPDKDFSSAKPANQVQANTFSTYLEPYFRPFDDQDLAFLRERGDRVTPFITPHRGKRHYTEIWAEEDNHPVTDTTQGREKLPLNQPRGSIDRMNDDVAESDAISTGPILSRLLATLRPEHRASSIEIANGISNDQENNTDLNDILGTSSENAIQTSATQMPESNTEAWKKALHPTLDYAQMDERIKLELRHIGFLPLENEPNYDIHNDDDVAVRLRYLQAKLKKIAILNGARKARLRELVKEKMAHQEFSTILEDLDSQVQTAYLKRTRTLGKSKKAKRPGGAGGGSHFVAGTSGSGMARPGIGDMTKTLMERRRKWIDTIGGVLDPEATKVRRVKDPESSIFGADMLAEFIRKEETGWDEGEDDE